MKTLTAKSLNSLAAHILASRTAVTFFYLLEVLFLNVQWIIVLSIGCSGMLGSTKHMVLLMVYFIICYFYVATYIFIIVNFSHNFLALCKYGPRVIVRCTKPIDKGDEVCITYVDLLQTRVLFSWIFLNPNMHNFSDTWTVSVIY